MAATTGMLMVGKMSVAVRAIASAPKRKIRMARTMNVYGRCSAIRTIHMHSYSWAAAPAGPAMVVHCCGALHPQFQSVGDAPHRALRLDHFFLVPGAVQVV